MAIFIRETSKAQQWIHVSTFQNCSDGVKAHCGQRLVCGQERGRWGKWSRKDCRIIGNPAEWRMSFRQDLLCLSIPPPPSLPLLSKKLFQSQRKQMTRLRLIQFTFITLALICLWLQWVNSLFWHFSKHRKQLQAPTAATQLPQGWKESKWLQSKTRACSIHWVKFSSHPVLPPASNLSAEIPFYERRQH